MLSQRLDNCCGSAPSKTTLITILKDFGPTAVIFGAIGPVASFLKDITTSTVEIPFEKLKSRAHSVANTMSILVATSGIIDAAISIVDNYNARTEAEKEKGVSYKVTTSGKIAIALEAAATGVGIVAIQRSGTPGAELDTIASSFAAGALGKIARVFHDRDTKAVREGTADVRFRFGQGEQKAEPQAPSQGMGQQAYVALDGSAPPTYKAAIVIKRP